MTAKERADIRKAIDLLADDDGNSGGYDAAMRILLRLAGQPNRYDAIGKVELQSVADVIREADDSPTIPPLR